VIAADRGVDHALALGLSVDLAIGDFDSVSDAGLAAVREAGGAEQAHPRDKDATDLELALDAARDLGARRVLVLGGGGGRLDHLLASALLLARPAYAALQVDAVLGGTRIAVVRDRRVLDGQAGDLVTLLPLGGPARGVRTEGLRYPLAGENLEPGSTRGVSNVLLGDRASVSVREGVVLAVQPGPERR
jgi:thiamine pyrophosphokinase